MWVEDFSRFSWAFINKDFIRFVTLDSCIVLSDHPTYIESDLPKGLPRNVS